MTMVGRNVSVLLVLLLAVGSLAAFPSEPGRAGVPCTGSPATARTLTVTVDGEPATGLFAVPAVTPRALVVFAHGYSHTAESWRSHLTRTAETEGVIAVAMDYRGTEVVDTSGEVPRSRGWPVTAGAADTVAAAQLFERRCPSVETIVVHGLSMGGNVSGLAVAAGATRNDGSPLFDVWIDVEGATNVVETYQAARVLAPVNAFAADAVEDVEAETGGTFEQVPSAYRERAVVTRAGDIAAAGLRGAILVHGVDDGLVPYNQSREMAAGLHAVGVPAEVHTVLTREADSEPGTTISGTVLDPSGLLDPPTAGHASDSSDTHTVAKAGFAALSAVLSGAEVRCGEVVIDGLTGVRTGLLTRC
jgi:acetyl esterase/lipase